jgi:hypothetical protein
MTTNPPADVQNLILRLKGVSYFPTAVDLNAIQNLVARGYGHGWYQLCDIVYPIMGNTAASQSLELKHPAVSTFNLVYTATVTNTAQGMNGDGVTGFAATGWNPSVSGVNWATASAAYGVYCNNVVSEVDVISGGRNATFDGSLIALNFTGSGFLAQCNAFSSSFVIAAAGPFTNGVFSCVRISSANMQVWQGGVLRNTAAAPNTATTTAFNLLSGNDNGTATQNSTSRIALAYYGSGAISQPLLSTDVVQYQTILGRA